MLAGWRTTLQQVWMHRGLLAWLLWPLSQLFRGMVAIRRLLYRLGLFKSHALPVPVIVVGNTVVGGVGKTPVVMALVQHLQDQGWTVGVVSRGYGRRTQDCREVMDGDTASVVGDEPLLIRKRTNAPVFVANNRYMAGAYLLKTYPQTTVIVCDDGLQHLALHRNMEICVFDDRGAGNGFMLPAGLLREPWPRRSEVTSWVLHTGTQPAFDGYRATRRLADTAVRANGSQISLRLLATDRTTPLLALAGIAQPEVFFDQLRAQGLHLSATQALPDHFNFDSFNLSIYEGYQLICTEKDAVKLWRIAPHALAVPLTVTLDTPLLVSLDAALAAKLSSPQPSCR
jgi:tetraacyldisaccharide 4'-kinase